MKQKLLLLSLASLIFASCSTTLERKVPAAFGGSWNSEAKKTTASQIDIDTKEQFAKSEDLKVNENISVKQELNSNSNSEIYLLDLKEENEKHTISRTSKLKTSIRGKFIQPMVTKFVKKIDNIKEKGKLASDSSGASSTFSIVSLILGILGLFVFSWLLGPLAIIFGALGLSRGGKGLAIAGLILGIIDLVLWIFLYLLILASL